jgi:hypothetical protein
MLRCAHGREYPTLTTTVLQAHTGLCRNPHEPLSRQAQPIADLAEHETLIGKGLDLSG